MEKLSGPKMYDAAPVEGSPEETAYAAANPQPVAPAPVAQPAGDPAAAQAEFEGRQTPDAAPSGPDDRLVAHATDYLKEKYKTGGMAAERMGLTDEAFDVAGRELAGRIHAQTSQAYEDLFTGRAEEARLAAEQAAADAEFLKMKALNPDKSDEEIHAGIAQGEANRKRAGEVVGGVLSNIANAPGLKQVGEVAKQAADVSEGLLGIGTQKVAEGVLGERAGRGQAEQVVTSAVTAETDQMPEWLRPFATPFLYGAAAGEAKRIEQERADLPSVEIGGVKLDILTMAEMGLPLGGGAEVLLKTGALGRVGGLGAKLVKADARVSKGQLTAEQIVDRLGAAPSSPTAGRVVASQGKLGETMAARAGEADPIAAKVAAGRDLTKLPERAAQDTIDAAAGRVPTKDVSTVADDLSGQRGVKEVTNDAARAQIEDARSNRMGQLGGAVLNFAKAEGGAGRLDLGIQNATEWVTKRLQTSGDSAAVDGYLIKKTGRGEEVTISKDGFHIGYGKDIKDAVTTIKTFLVEQGGEGKPIGMFVDLAKAAVNQAKKLGKQMSPEDEALIKRIAEKADRGDTLTSVEQAVINRLEKMRPKVGEASGAGAKPNVGRADVEGGMPGPEARAAQGRVSQPRPLEGGLTTTEMAGRDVGKLTKAIQAATGGRIRSIQQFGKAVREGDKAALEGVPDELISTFLRGTAEKALREAGVSGDVINDVLSKLGGKAPTADAVIDAAKAAGVADDTANAAATATEAARGATTLFGDAPKGGQGAVARAAAQRAEATADGVDAQRGVGGMDAPPTGNASKQPPFGPERMPGDVQKPVQGQLKTATTPHLDAKGRPVKIDGKTVQQTEIAPGFGAGDAKVPAEPLAFPSTPIKAKFNARTGTFDTKDIDDAVRQLRIKFGETAAADAKKQGMWNAIVSTLNLPRTLETGWDLSAPLRQGLILSVAHPDSFIEATGAMLKAFSPKGGEKFAEAVNNLIKSSPNAEHYKTMKLFFSEMGTDLTTHEEAVMSNVTKKFGGALGLRASQRAYNTFLNKLRADVADNAIAAANVSKRGSFSKEELEALGAFINHATGRGDLGKLSHYGPALNTLFYSPRYAVSRIQVAGDAAMGAPHSVKALINKVTGSDLEVNRGRQMAANDVAKWIGFQAGALGLAKLAHEAGVPGIGDVEADPRSSDAGKFIVGDHRIDMWGGEQQWIRFAVQAATGEKKYVSGRHEGDIVTVARLSSDFDSVVTKFLRSKLAPITGKVADYAEGQHKLKEKNSNFSKASREAEGGDFLDQPYGISFSGTVYTVKDLLNPLGQNGILTPLSWSDMIQAVDHELNGGGGNVARGVGVGAAAMFGASVQTHTDDDSGGGDVAAPTEEKKPRAYGQAGE